MIHRLEIENFYSIRDLQIIDLLAAANAPDEFERLAPLWPGARERAPKVVALFGANASGKSNVLKGLSFLAWFVKDSFQVGPHAHLPYQRFNDARSRARPTRLAVHFVAAADPNRIGDAGVPRCTYRYEVSLRGSGDKPQRVLRETLKYWPPNAGRQVHLFDRNEAGLLRAAKPFALAGYRQAIEKVLRPNASVVSTLTQLKHPMATRLWSLAASIITNITTEKHDFTDDSMARHYDADPKLVKLLNRDLQRIGLGLRSMKIQKGPDGPFAVFEHEGLAGPLPVQLESHGTRLFVRIFPLLVQALEAGGLAVIDELDLSIHPMVLPEIVRWFHDSDRNPHNAQLWMTCQNASLLEELTKEEVLFCEKDSGGRTSVYGLSDVQGVRRGDNYYRKYLSGLYGAVPHLG